MSVARQSRPFRGGEMEADLIRGILEAGGVFSIVSGIWYVPFEFDVKVARADVHKARRLIEDARTGGPKAAEEAEAASERQE